MNNAAMEEKISAYLDETLTRDEMDELATWIKADPANASQFARASMLHDRLQSEMSAMKAEAKKIVPFPIPWLAAAGAAAAAIVLALGIWQVSQSSSPDFVTIVRVEETDLEVGQRRGAGLIQLDTGMLRMLFDSGVEVTLQGPAQFELVKEDLMLLSTGLLTANVPPGAEGFRVDTPTAQITDLGTAFGVHLGLDGTSHVSVFDGEVEVEEPESGTRKLLTEGQEVIVTPDHKVESVSLDTTPYEKLWPVSTGIESSDGAFELAPPWPRRLPLHSSDDHAFVAPDGYRMKLARSLKVNASKPGAVVVPDDLTPAEIPAGTPLRSYILHYRPEELAPRRFPIRLSGTITFDQPIAGLIVSSNEFLASVGVFSSRKVGEKHPRRELELSGDQKGDRFELSDDMRTLTVDFAGSRRAFDVIRVLVDASAPEGENP
ncbi:MAG: FecR family protein [Verrucomicrobiota bacterium]